MKKDEFEDIFKDSFEDFEAEVSPNVWKNVQTVLKGAGIGLLGKAILNKIGANTLIAVISSAAAVVGTVVVMNWGGKAEPKPVAKNAMPKVIEKPKPAKLEEIRDFLSDKPVVKPATAPAKTEVKKENELKADPVIKKDEMQEVISEYSDVMVATISASPVGGTVPLVVNLSNNGIGKINKWNFGDGQKENGANPVHVYDTPGLYTIMLQSTSTDGKTSTDSIKIEVTGNSSMAAIPSDFSPNGDGKKDNFSFNPVNMKSMSVAIFDKNYNVVFRSEKLDAKWDGNNLKGKPAKEATYFYIVNSIGLDGKKHEQKGKIILSR